jgi:gliding motility-associated-like protein
LVKILCAIIRLEEDSKTLFFFYKAVVTMKFLFAILCCFVVVSGLNAQTTDDLVAYYDFNDSTAIDKTGSGSNGQLIGDTVIICGPDRLAIKLDGVDDHILFLGLIGNYFEKDDFTFSFFMHPTAVPNPLITQTIFSKRENCDATNAFSIRYAPTTNSVTLEMSEDASKRVVLSTPLDIEKCWQHITIVRQGASVKLYVNGILRESGSTVSRIDITNSAVLYLAEGACVGSIDGPFGGAIDEIRLYDRALDNREVEGLYTPLAPDNIITADTTVFLGNDVQIVTGNTCADDINWFPTDNLSDASINNPLISPMESTVYTVEFRNSSLGCAAEDSIRITIINPDDLDCTKVFLPNAFTPNGDGLNDTYGISNPYAISELVSFEIFDRWGGRVFMTIDAMERWDGNFKGKPMNPGVLLYKVIHLCEGEEIVDVGSLSIIR